MPPPPQGFLYTVILGRLICPDNKSGCYFIIIFIILIWFVQTEFEALGKKYDKGAIIQFLWGVEYF